MHEDSESSAPEGATTRRDALKMTGAAALGGVAAAIAGAAAPGGLAGAATSAVAPLTSPPKHVPTSLQVAIDGVLVPGVHSMEVLSGEYATTSQTDSAGYYEQIDGLQAQRISLTRTFTGDRAFATAFSAAGTPKGAGAPGSTLTVRVLGRKDSLINTFSMSDCTAVRWSGPTYDKAVMAKGGAADQPNETVEFAFRKIEWT